MTTTETTASNELAAPLTATAATLAALRERPALRLHECIVLVNVSRSTLVRAIKAGDLAAHKVGRAVYVPTSALLAFVGADPKQAA